MSRARNDGGPAFPHLDWFATDGGPVAVTAEQAGGMSLRDYFAAKAMHGELVTAGAVAEAAVALAEAAQRDGQTIVERIAVNAYLLADAMLKAREVKHEISDDAVRGAMRAFGISEGGR